MLTSIDGSLGATASIFVRYVTLRSTGMNLYDTRDLSININQPELDPLPAVLDEDGMGCVNACNDS